MITEIDARWTFIDEEWTKSLAGWATPNLLAVAAQSVLRHSGHDETWCAGIAKEIVAEFAATGLVIVPAASVPTEEQRAAVGRLVEVYAARMAYVRNSSPSDEMALWKAVRDAQDAIQPGDWDAARAVAEGGTNGA